MDDIPELETFDNNNIDYNISQIIMISEIRKISNKKMNNYVFIHGRYKNRLIYFNSAFTGHKKK